MLLRISAAANSFFDLTTRIDSDNKTSLENTVGPNKFEDFEHFSGVDTKVMKTIFAMNWPNRPGDCITLRHNRFANHVI